MNVDNVDVDNDDNGDDDNDNDDDDDNDNGDDDVDDDNDDDDDDDNDDVAPIDTFTRFRSGVRTRRTYSLFHLSLSSGVINNRK